MKQKNKLDKALDYRRHKKRSIGKHRLEGLK